MRAVNDSRTERVLAEAGAGIARVLLRSRCAGTLWPPSRRTAV
jgi:hypothetical protein